MLLCCVSTNKKRKNYSESIENLPNKKNNSDVKLKDTFIENSSELISQPDEAILNNDAISNIQKDCQIETSEVKEIPIYTNNSLDQIKRSLSEKRQIFFSQENNKPSLTRDETKISKIRNQTKDYARSEKNENNSTLINTKISTVDRNDVSDTIEDLENTTESNKNNPEIENETKITKENSHKGNNIPIQQISSTDNSNEFLMNTDASIQELENFTENKSEHRQIGLENLGNTCYANSLLQILCRTKLFKEIINNYWNSYNQNSIINSLVEIINYFDGSKNCIDSSIRKLIKRVKFQMGHQNDSAEFLSILLKELTEDCPAITHIFYGIKENRFKFEKNEVITDEKFLIISLQDYYTIINEIEEEIEDYGTIKTTIKVFPQILILQNSHYSHENLRKRIQIESYLTINFNKSQCANNIVYDLYGMIVHYGTRHGGHYICYFRENILADSWRMYNDSSVSSEIKIQQIHDEPFLLFYQQNILPSNEG